MSATLILGMSWLWKTPPDRDDDASHEPDVAGGRAAGDPALAEPGRSGCRAQHGRQAS